MKRAVKGPLLIAVKCTETYVVKSTFGPIIAPYYLSRRQTRAAPATQDSKESGVVAIS